MLNHASSTPKGDQSSGPFRVVHSVAAMTFLTAYTGKLDYLDLRSEWPT